MARAKDEIEMAKSGKGCLGKAHPDEPVFILRAQDSLAAALVLEWADRAELLGCPFEKIVEARALAAAMFAWPTRKFPD